MTGTSRRLFMVAPMMAHTHRHWRVFFRLISRRAVLFTEMIPARRVPHEATMERLSPSCSVFEGEDEGATLLQVRRLGWSHLRL